MQRTSLRFLRHLALALAVAASFAALAQLTARTSSSQLARELPGDEGAEAEG
jgi:hypothetical protein